VRRALVVNATLAAAAWAAAAPRLPGELRMLGAALVVLAIPGIAWLGVFRGKALTPARLALAVTGVSCAAAAVGLAIGSAFPPPHALPFLVWTFAATNLGLALAGPWPRLDPSARWRLLGGIAAAGFLATALAAIHLVPPLEDHDMEVRGTAYGLASDLKPYFTSNREVFLPMSHPVLFNVLVAQSLVVTGEIEAVRPSYDSSRKAEAAALRGEPFPWEAAWRADYDAFLARPALAGTRAPSAFFAGLLLALLADVLLRVTGSAFAASAGALLYATVPETVVRSAYAGYFSETVFAMLVATILLTEDESPGAASWVAAAGAFMALLDHKTVVLALAVSAWAGGTALLRRERPDRRAVALVAGFGAGTLAWWAYGFWVSPRVFIDDHLRKHLVHRFLLNDVRFAADHVNRYAPSIPELWREFASHTGWLLVPVAAAGAVAALRRRADPALTVLALWCVAGAVAFSLTDWRQTKHLMNGLAPMVILAVAWGWPPRGWRRYVLGLLLVAAIVDLGADVRLLRDFRSLHVSGASDIDGW
jgi:hypothetical protein